MSRWFQMCSWHACAKLFTVISTLWSKTRRLPWSWVRVFIDFVSVITTRTCSSLTKLTIRSCHLNLKFHRSYSWIPWTNHFTQSSDHCGQQNLEQHLRSWLACTERKQVRKSTTWIWINGSAFSKMKSLWSAWRANHIHTQVAWMTVKLIWPCKSAAAYRHSIGLRAWKTPRFVISND